jgi:hypothetical protein
VPWIRAASTSCASDRANAPGSVSWAPASTRAADSEISPSSTARRVTGMSSSARATRTLWRAVPQATLNLEASQEAADKYPSRS